MFQYALGRTLADRHGVDLEFDVSRFENADVPAHAQAPALRDLAVRGTFSPVGAHSRFWLRPGLAGGLWWRVEQYLLPVRWRRFVEQRPGDFLRNGRMFDPEVLETRPGTYLAGWWISPRYFAGAEARLREDLVLRAPLSAREWINAIQSRNAVAIHVRRGDYLLHPEIGVLEKKYYAGAIQAIRSCVSDPHYFVFSDDVPAARELLRGVIDKFDVVQLEAGASPAQDLAVMASCRHFIIANSTFSWWGAWLAANDGKIVIAPSHWYVGARVSVPDVYPEKWIQVPC